MRTTITLPDKVYVALRIQAAKERRSLTALMCEAVERYLAEVKRKR